MNWIERLYQIKGKDLYSQNGEGLILEYMMKALLNKINSDKLRIVDIGGGDGFYLSNSRHLENIGWDVIVLDLEKDINVNVENCLYLMPDNGIDIISIDIDGNDFWILDRLLIQRRPNIIVAEFNAAYTDSRTIAYNPNHIWAGDSYYGFSFEAGKKLAQKHGYKVIFQLADMNLFMVRADLIDGVTFPEVTFKQNNFFKLSERTDWVTI